MGRTLRELEPMTAGRRPGDLPGDPPQPGAVRHAVRFEVSGATLALLRDARIALDAESDERLDDDALVAAMCRAVLDGPREADQGRARYQIATTTCDTCERAYQDIPPAVRRLVTRRDHGRCFVPGCRSSVYLDLHHIRWRTHGGGHTADNLAVCCGAHHTSIHDGRLIVEGTISSGVTFTHDDGRPYGAPPGATITPEAIAALRKLGFTAAEARSAVTFAESHVGSGASVVEVIRAALKSLRPASVS